MKIYKKSKKQSDYTYFTCLVCIIFFLSLISWPTTASLAAEIKQPSAKSSQPIKTNKRDIGIGEAEIAETITENIVVTPFELIQQKNGLSKITKDGKLRVKLYPNMMYFDGLNSSTNQYAEETVFGASGEVELVDNSVGKLLITDEGESNWQIIHSQNGHSQKQEKSYYLKTREGLIHKYELTFSILDLPITETRSLVFKQENNQQQLTTTDGLLQIEQDYSTKQLKLSVKNSKWQLVGETKIDITARVSTHCFPHLFRSN